MRTLFKASKTAKYYSVPSLPLVLKEHIKTGDSEGTLIIADEQQSNYLPKGGLWFSFYIEPIITKKELPLIPLIATTATVAAIKSLTGLEIKIKWPKNIVLDYKKVADICCQLETHNTPSIQMIKAIVSVGMNSNLETNSIPENNRSKITSILEETSCSISNGALLNLFCYEFEKRYRILNSGKSDSLIEEYRNLLTTINKEIVVTSEEKEESGRAVAIEEDGSLLFRTKEGKLKRVCSSDVMLCYN